MAAFLDGYPISPTRTDVIKYGPLRHGLETLFQLIEYDDILHTFIIVDSAIIIDYPEFRHRGIMIDTAKNFVEPIVIKRIIDGMASSKVRASSK